MQHIKSIHTKRGKEVMYEKRRRSYEWRPKCRGFRFVLEKAGRGQKSFTLFYLVYNLCFSAIVWWVWENKEFLKHFKRKRGLLYYVREMGFKPRFMSNKNSGAFSMYGYIRISSFSMPRVSFSENNRLLLKTWEYTTPCDGLLSLIATPFYCYSLLGLRLGVYIFIREAIREGTAGTSMRCV